MNLKCLTEARLPGNFDEVGGVRVKWHSNNPLSACFGVFSRSDSHHCQDRTVKKKSITDSFILTKLKWSVKTGSDFSLCQEFAFSTFCLAF